jgi:hypothetical protein
MLLKSPIIIIIIIIIIIVVFVVILVNKHLIELDDYKIWTKVNILKCIMFSYIQN